MKRNLMLILSCLVVLSACASDEVSLYFERTKKLVNGQSMASIKEDEERAKKYQKIVVEQKEKSEKEKIMKESMYDNFCQPFKNALEQGQEPFDAYKILLIKLEKNMKGRKTQKNVSVAKELSKLTTKAQKRKEMASVFNDIHQMCLTEQSSIIQEKINTYYTQEEQNIFRSRTGGRTISDDDLGWFVISNFGKIPNQKKIYSYQPTTSAVFLKVLQIVSGGVLVQGDFAVTSLYNSGFPDKILFIKTTTKYVDGDIIKTGFYKSIGIKEYSSILGASKRIHAFEDMPNIKTEDLYFY